MRCFIGIPLSDKVRQRLVKAQKAFSNIGRTNLVKPEHMHISLKFLGDVEPKMISKKLSSISFNSFSVSVKDISFFPKPDYIRVIHSPVDQGLTELTDLYKKIISSLNLRPDRFNPHVTLARVKFVKKASDIVSVCLTEKFELDFPVNLFNLYSSVLTPQGPIYEVVKSFSSKDNT